MWAAHGDFLPEWAAWKGIRVGSSFTESCQALPPRWPRSEPLAVRHVVNNSMAPGYWWGENDTRQALWSSSSKPRPVHKIWQIPSEECSIKQMIRNLQNCKAYQKQRKCEKRTQPCKEIPKGMWQRNIRQCPDGILKQNERILNKVWISCINIVLLH